jgi:NAD(P)-dependent dehydrogenase (short-subunit alcohol dehydrogenase family)
MSWSIGTGLEGHSVVVTGAAGGIGQAVVGCFAAVGARVCAVDLDQAAVESVIAATDDPARHLAVASDITDLDHQPDVLRHVCQVFGRFDVLAHLAAVVVRHPSLDDVTEADWDFQNTVNLKATFFIDRAAGQLMKEQGRGGRIINFTSQAWWTGGLAGSIVYAATKGGIVSLTRGFARAFATDGITVNVVAPGGVDTPMAHSQSKESLEAFIGQTPVGRLAEPFEIAAAVVFLASRHATYITGATLNMTGGQLMY